MSEKRKADAGRRQVWFRSGSRIFADRGRWYFSTREGTIEGPYADRYSAERMLESYIEVMSSRFVPSTELTLMDDVAPSALAARSVEMFDLGLGRFGRAR